MPPTPPNPPRKRRRILRATTIATLLVIAAYIAGTIHFAFSRSGPTRDYYAELDARNLGTTEDQKSWSIYHDASNEWNAMTRPIMAEVMRLDQEHNQRQFDLEAADPDYKRQSRSESDENPFGIADDHPLHADALAALESFQPSLIKVRAASNRPISGTPITDNWTLNAENLPDTPLPPTPELERRVPILFLPFHQITNARRLIHVLSFDSFSAANERDGNRVIANTEAMINIARHTLGEPLVISQLVAHANLESAGTTIGGILDRQPSFLSAQQLEHLQRLLWNDATAQARIDFTDEFLAQQEFIDRTYTIDASGNGNISSEGLGFLLSIKEGSQPSPAILALLWPARFVFAERREQQEILDESARIILALTHDGPTAYPTFFQSLTALQERETSRRFVPWRKSTLLTGLAKAATLPHLTRTRLQATATRLALERYKIAQGRYPDTLAQLVPTYLPELPPDPFNPGHRLNYLLQDGTPYIYSVGTNGIDNQATPAPPGTKPANLEARFANPDSPSPDAPEADWILSPPQD